MTAAGTAVEISYPNGGLTAEPPINGGSTGASVASEKKGRESERRRRRRKQKKNKASSLSANAGGDESEGGGDEAQDEAKDNSDANPEVEVSVEVEYVPEKVDVGEIFLEDFKNVFEKFSFQDSAASAEDDAKKDDTAANAASKKKGDSDSEEEEQDAQLKEKGISNKKKKLQRRMKIAELKQICSRPDVVEVWDATAADPKLLAYLKAYRNTVPVPRHWCQKRKFLQGIGCNIQGAGTWWCLPKGPLKGLSFNILIGWWGVVR